MALTFEYVPFMKPMGFFRARELSNMILRNLKQEEIQAAGFVVQSKVEDDPSTYVILDDWAAQGGGPADSQFRRLRLPDPAVSASLFRFP